MSIKPVYYIIVSEDILIDSGYQRIFVCLNLIDHRIMGISTTRDGALEEMSKQYEELHHEMPEV